MIFFRIRKFGNDRRLRYTNDSIVLEKVIAFEVSNCFRFIVTLLYYILKICFSIKCKNNIKTNSPFSYAIGSSAGVSGTNLVALALYFQVLLNAIFISSNKNSVQIV